ncbi:MAG: hypothetical protein ACYC9S_07670 [Leptospirales bacterium]
MDGTIGTKLPEEEGEVLEKIAAERKESVSVFVRNLIREAIGKNGKVEGAGEDRLDEVLSILRTIGVSKPGQDSVLYGDPGTTKKLDEIMKILSGFQPMMNDQIKKLREEIALIPKVNGGTDSYPLILESLERNAKELRDLKPAIEQIRGTAGIDVSFKNPEFRKRIFVVWAISLLVFGGLGGWGTWSFYRYAKNVGAADEAAYANSVSRSFYDLMQCDEPGWKAEWVKDGKELYCYPYQNEKDGKVYGWMVR